jgi:2-keto-4-pentenoate hydratase/2-oxohepta-3-ene-1,7-dioic acid hydratase in catechol pathway
MILYILSVKALYVLIMYNARRIPFSNLSSVEKEFHLKNNASARDLLSTQTHGTWLKANKLSNNAPVKPLAEAKKKNHRMKSQLNLSKSLLEDMDEHAPIMPPIATSYIPCHQKQLTAHRSTDIGCSCSKF